MKTSNETIKVTPNYSKRTFTIRKYIDGVFFAKYRTNPISKDEFESDEYMTENDWKSYLRKSNNYYAV